MMSVEPFNRLVKLAARAFYDEIPLKGDNQQKIGRSDNKGIAVVILDALTRRQWVREEDLAKELKLHSKQLRRTLRFFEEEKFVTRYHRKETAKGAKVYDAAVAAIGAGHQIRRDGDEKNKLHTYSYCCLDYAQIYDVIRYRLHRMRKKLKDELDDKYKVQEYICPNCNKRYTALDAGRLVSMEDYDFHCEVCNGILVAESEKLVGKGFGDADDNAKRHNNDRVQEILNKIEKQLKPLIEQVNRVKDLAVPEFSSLQAWEERKIRELKGVLDDSDPTKSSQGLGGTPMPHLGETKVEVDFSEKEENGEKIQTENGDPKKAFPPWMYKQGMKLTPEQRGAVKEESKVEVSSSVHGQSSEGENKSGGEKDEEEKLQDEYLKAYYAAFLQRQLEQEEAAKREQELSDFKTSNGGERQVGMKSKRDDDNDEADVVWEEASAGNNARKPFKMVDLNVEAEEEGSGEDDDDDIWEEG